MLPASFPPMSPTYAAMLHSSFRTFCLVALLTLCSAPCAFAQQGRGRGADQDQQDSALSDSVRRVERDTRGQVLSAERIPFDGRDVNRIKVVDDRGRVRVYMDDPQRRRDDGRRGDERRGPPARDDDD